MCTIDTYLAVFLGNKTSPRRKAWDAMPGDEGHPHFTIFPGEAVEVMPLLPVAGA